jgi:hypothetical protein
MILQRSERKIYGLLIYTHQSEALEYSNPPVQSQLVGRPKHLERC